MIDLKRFVETQSCLKEAGGGAGALNRSIGNMGIAVRPADAVTYVVNDRRVLMVEGTFDREDGLQAGRKGSRGRKVRGTDVWKRDAGNVRCWDRGVCVSTLYTTEPYGAVGRGAHWTRLRLRGSAQRVQGTAYISLTTRCGAWLPEPSSGFRIRAG